MIIALTGQKGGSGKTTTSLCIADEWHRRGKHVLVVDLDAQGSARTWHDVAAERDHDGPTVISMGEKFNEQLADMAQVYDHIVVDCPSNKLVTQKRALMVADLVILPCGPGSTDLWSMAETLELAQNAMDFRPLLNAAILITRRDPRTIQGQLVTQALKETGFDIFSTQLANRVAYQEFPATGLGVTRYAPKDKASDEIKSLLDEIETRYGQKET